MPIIYLNSAIYRVVVINQEGQIPIHSPKQFNLIAPYKINFSSDLLDDLKTRLSVTRWPDEITGSGWRYGASLAYMKELIDYWHYQFDWRFQESLINSYPNYMATLDGYRIHFLHIKGNGRRNIPLIITHGWPGSFLEMMKIIPLLSRREGSETGFDVVIPSMPGFGLSPGSNIEGMNVHKIAALWIKLMDELGYKKFGAQGGDFGAGVSTALAFHYPEHLTGIHLNYIPGSYKPFSQDGLADAEKKFLDDAEKWFMENGAYQHMQKTRPLTLAYGLTDSPAGLAAWLVEKYYEWGDCKGNIDSRFSKDELLCNITLYWLTNTIHSSCRLYVENSRVPFHFKKGASVHGPCGIAHFPVESPFPPREYIERVYNVTHWSEMSSGGHFAAMEEPELLADDISKFFTSISIVSS